MPNLGGIADGEQPCKHSGVVINSQDSKHPGQPQQGKEDNSGLQDGPIGKRLGLLAFVHMLKSTIFAVEVEHLSHVLKETHNLSCVLLVHIDYMYPEYVWQFHSLCCTPIYSIKNNPETLNNNVKIAGNANHFSHFQNLNCQLWWFWLTDREN